MNLGEEPKEGVPQPEGPGAFWSITSLMLFYLILIIVVLFVLSDKESAEANTNVLYAIANKLFASSYMPSVKDILDKSVAATCFQICFYMSMAGFACAWYYREKLGAISLKEKVSYVVWPFLSASFMVCVAVYSAVVTFDTLTNAIGIGGLALGFIPLALCRQRKEVSGLNIGEPAVRL